MAETVDENVMRIGKRCYVSNLAWKTSWQDLKDRFRECGNVVYANVMRDEEGRSKGWGIVEFETPEEAVAAVNALNGSELGGRKIMVREDREDRDVKQYNKENGIKPAGFRGPAGARRKGQVPRDGEQPPADGGSSSGLQVVVQGIPWSYTWQELKKLFADVGEVERSDVAYGPGNRSRGYGTVKFASKETAQAAIDKFHGTTLENRTLTVFFDKYA